MTVSAVAAADTVASLNPGVGPLTVVKPSGLADNDVVYLVVTCSGGTGITGSITCTGFTQVAAVDCSTFDRLTVLRKVITSAAGEPASYSIAWDGVSRQVGICCMGYRGVDTTTPEDVTAVTNVSTTTSTTVSSATGGVTTVTDNAWLMWCVGVASASQAIGLATGFTDRGQASGQHTDLQDELFATAGSTGTISCTLSVAQRYANALLALRPAGGAAVTPLEYVIAPLYRN
jgi:hypothetical protein